MCVPRQLSVGGLTKDGLPFGANAKFNQQGRETCLPFVLFLSQGFCTKLITQWLICFCRAITANVYRRLWQVWVSCDFTVLVRAYACLLACLDRPLTVTLPALILCILWNDRRVNFVSAYEYFAHSIMLNQWPVKPINGGTTKARIFCKTIEYKSKL